VQSTAEGEPMTRQLDQVLDLASKGMGELAEQQRKLLKN
jgi:ribonuclease PH